MLIHCLQASIHSLQAKIRKLEAALHAHKGRQRALFSSRNKAAALEVYSSPEWKRLQLREDAEAFRRRCQVRLHINNATSVRAGGLAEQNLECSAVQSPATTHSIISYNK